MAKETILRDEFNRAIVHLKDIYPQRIIKQIYANLLSTISYNPEDFMDSIKQFIMNDNSQIPTDNIKVYMYKNISSFGRITPLCSVANGDNMSIASVFIAEVSFPPIGIIFSFTDSPLFENMQEITNWQTCGLNEKASLILKLPELII